MIVFDKEENRFKVAHSTPELTQDLLNKLVWALANKTNRASWFDVCLILGISPAEDDEQMENFFLNIQKEIIRAKKPIQPISRLERILTLTIPELLGKIEQSIATTGHKILVEIPNDGFRRIDFASGRLRTYHDNGVVCVECGLEATVAYVERTWFTPRQKKREQLHVNLYGTNAEGREIMMTRDHIIPRSRKISGLVEDPINYQPMCELCNGRKKDAIKLDVLL